jgi:hypothetical protein
MNRRAEARRIAFARLPDLLLLRAGPHLRRAKLTTTRG